MLLCFTGVNVLSTIRTMAMVFLGHFSILGILLFELFFLVNKEFSASFGGSQPSLTRRPATTYSRLSIFTADSPVEQCTDCGGKHYRKLPLSPGNPCNNGPDRQLPLTCFALPLNISTKIFCHQMTNDLFLSVIH